MCMCMKFTCVDLIEVMYGRPRVNLQVEPHSTFLSTLLSIHCLYFSYIREFYIRTWKSCDSGNQPFLIYLTCAYSNFFFSTHIPTSLSCTAMCIHRRGHFPWRADTNPCGPSNSHFGASIVRWASYYKKCPYEAGTLSGRYSREVVFFDLLKGYLSLQLGHYCNDK